MINSQHTVGENIVGVPNMQNDYCANQLLVFSIAPCKVIALNLPTISKAIFIALKGNSDMFTLLFAIDFKIKKKRQLLVSR